MKFQVSRAMPQKNPKVQGGSGFGFFQVFAHQVNINLEKFLLRQNGQVQACLRQACTCPFSVDGAV